MKAASSRARARKLLASAAALAATLTFNTPSAQADDHSNEYPEGYPKVGTSSESVGGFWLKVQRRDGTAARVMPNLFTVHTTAGMEGSIKAYCIELDVDIRYESKLRVGDWKDFPGTNSFKDNAEVQSKVAWIAQRSYPQTDLGELTKVTGISGLTEREAITATQAAIWSFTNPNDYKWLGIQEGDQATQSRVDQLFKYLTGENNNGLKESQQPTIDLQGSSSLAFTSGENNSEGKVGPIRFTSSQNTVKLTSEMKYELVTSEGTKVDTNAVPVDTDLFLKVPAGTTSGEQEFKATATGSVYAGKLLITKEAVAGGDHGQTIIIGSNRDVTVESQGKLTWSSTQQSTPPKVENTPPQDTPPAPQPSQPEATPPQPTQPGQETTQPSTETSRSTSTETSSSSTQTSSSSTTETSRSTGTTCNPAGNTGTNQTGTNGSSNNGSSSNGRETNENGNGNGNGNGGCTPAGGTETNGNTTQTNGNTTQTNGNGTACSPAGGTGSNQTGTNGSSNGNGTNGSETNGSGNGTNGSSSNGNGANQTGTNGNGGGCNPAGGTETNGSGTETSKPATNKAPAPADDPADPATSHKPGLPKTGN